MAAVLFRVVLLASGLGLGEMGLDSIARASGLAFVQCGLALILLTAGSAGVIVPLYASNAETEDAGHV